MIRLTEAQYTAIGRVAVQSGSLEREVTEYMARLGKPFKSGAMLGTKIDGLRKAFSVDPTASLARAEFDFAMSIIKDLIDKRNALAHGVWSTVTNVPLSLEETTAHGRKAAVRAVEIAAVAEQLRFSRKLLLRLCHDHAPVAAGPKKRPRATANTLRKQLIKAAKAP